MLDRRAFLSSGLAGAAAGALLSSSTATAQSTSDASRLNVKSFGARGDGRHDDTPAFRAAIQAGQNQGLVVFVPQGIYKIRGGGILITDSLLMEGIPGKSVLKFSDGPGLMTIDGASNVTVSGIDFDGNNRNLNQEGVVYVQNASHIRFIDCGIRRGRDGDGLQVYASQDVDVVRCRVQDVRYYGLFFLNSEGIRVIGCTVRNCKNNGIAVHRTSRGRARALIAHNFVARIDSQSGDGQNGNGINAYNADEVIITANNIRNCRFSAIRCNSCSDPIVTDNQCLHCDETAIFVEFAHSGSVVANNVVDHAVQGISVTNLDSGGRLSSITGNVVRNVFKLSTSSNPNTGYSSGISVEADAIVSGNVVEMGHTPHEPNLGILVGWGPYLRDVAVSGNQVRNADYGISVSVVDGAGNAKISGNFVTGSRRRGIGGNRWESELGIPLTDNTGGSRFPHIQLSDNWVR